MSHLTKCGGRVRFYISEHNNERGFLMIMFEVRRFGRMVIWFEKREQALLWLEENQGKNWAMFGFSIEKRG